MKVVVHTEDLVVLVSVMFLFVMSEIMEARLGKVCLWAGRCGLDPAKTGVMLFTTNTMVLELHFPRLNGQILTLSTNVKVLGVTIDPKLN